MRAVFLDKDGTLVENVPHNVTPDLVRLCPSVVEGLRLLRRCGYTFFIVSNQPGIAQGRFTEQDLRRALRHLENLLTQNGVTAAAAYYCPHHPDAAGPPCACRKPMPGMLLRAAREHGIDLSRSWMIGDILDDVEAGRRAGCRAALIDNGNETGWQRSRWRTPHLIRHDLHAAARAIATAEPWHAPKQEKTASQ